MESVGASDDGNFGFRTGGGGDESGGEDADLPSGRPAQDGRGDGDGGAAGRRPRADSRGPADPLSPGFGLGDSNEGARSGGRGEGGDGEAGSSSAAPAAAAAQSEEERRRRAEEEERRRLRAEAEAAARFKSTDELLAEEEAAAEAERRRLIELQAQAAREREAREMREAEDRRRAELMGMDITQYERWKLEHEGGEDADWEDSEFDWDAMDFSNAPPEVFDQIMEIMPEMQQARRASLQSTGLRKNPSPPPLGLTPKSPSKSLERSASARQINERIQAIISSPDASPERQQEERERRNAKMGLGHSPEARETRRQHNKADIAQVRAEAAATAARQHEEERRSRSSSPGAPLEVRGRSPSRTTAASLAEGLPPGAPPPRSRSPPPTRRIPPARPSRRMRRRAGALPPAHIVSPHILSGGVPKEPGQLSPGRQVLVSGEIRAYEADVAAAAAAASAPPPFARARSPGTSIGSPASPPPPSWYPDHPDSLHSSGSPRAPRV